MVKCTGRGLVVKRPGVLSKVQMLTLVLGVGVFSLLPRIAVQFAIRTTRFLPLEDLLDPKCLFCTSM